MKDRIIDPNLEKAQVKYRLKDGWGTSAMVVREPVPDWLKEVKLPVIKKFPFAGKTPAKTTVREIAEWKMRTVALVPYDDAVKVIEGVIDNQLSKWVMLGEVVLQSRYWDYLAGKAFFTQEHSIFITQRDKDESMAVFFDSEGPVAVVMGVQAKASSFMSVNSYICKELEVK